MPQSPRFLLAERITNIDVDEGAQETCFEEYIHHVLFDGQERLRQIEQRMWPLLDYTNAV